MKPQVRVLLLVPAFPGIFFLMFQFYAWYLEGLSADFDMTSFGYGLVSCFLIYLAASGNEPKWLHRHVKSDQQKR
jgi:hypothetical protein